MVEFERRGKVLPWFVLRPFKNSRPYWIDNRHYVIAAPSGRSILTGMVFTLIAFPGVPLFFTWIALKEVVFLYWAAFFLFIGVGGGILTDGLEKIRRVVVFDRVKGVFIRGDRKRQKNGAPRPLEVYPFNGFEARLASIYSAGGLSLHFSITLYHPAEKRGPVFSEWFIRRAHALGFWSFLVQYMDKKAPLPDVEELRPYPHRTSGVGDGDQWQAFEKQPDYIDPLDLFHRHRQFDPAEDDKKVCALYEPRNMEADIAPVTVRHDPCHHIEARDRITPLPKKVLRPFFAAHSLHMDDKTYLIGKKNVYDRFHYLAAWSLMCVGLALFSASSIAAWATLAISGTYFKLFGKKRREKTTVFDREKGQVILHHGLRLTPLVLDFDQCEGCLVKEEHREGFCTYDLYLRHPGYGSVKPGDYQFENLEYLLGFWSFLVQYMDKTKPLPDIKHFENLPGREKGWGDWQDWAAKTLEKDFVDPFKAWLDELDGQSDRDHSSGAVLDEKPLKPEPAALATGPQKT